MGVFLIKENDTLPILEVVLKNPDGTVHDLSRAGHSASSRYNVGGFQSPGYPGPW